MIIVLKIVTTEFTMDHSGKCDIFSQLGTQGLVLGTLVAKEVRPKRL